MWLLRKAPAWERVALWMLIALFLAVIYSFSAEPAVESSETSGRISMRIAEWFFRNPTAEQYHFFEVLVRKTAHMTEYAALMLAISHMFRQSNEPHPGLHALICVLFWAISDEFHQAFVPGRACMFTDVLIDLMGAGFSVPLRHFTISACRALDNRFSRSRSSSC